MVPAARYTGQEHLGSVRRVISEQLQVPGPPVPEAFSELTGSAGIVATQEWAAGSSQSKTNLEGVVSVSWQVFKYIDPKTTMDLNLAFFPSLTESGRYRGAGNLNLIHKFIGDVTVGITAYLSYDNRRYLQRRLLVRTVGRTRYR